MSGEYEEQMTDEKLPQEELNEVYGTSTSKPASMPLINRVLHYIYSRLLTNKAGNYANLAKMDNPWLPKLIKKEPLNPGQIICFELLRFLEDQGRISAKGHTSKSPLPFPQLISCLLESFKIKSVEADGNKNCSQVSMSTLRRMHIPVGSSAAPSGSQASMAPSSSQAAPVSHAVDNEEVQSTRAAHPPPRPTASVSSNIMNELVFRLSAEFQMSLEEQKQELIRAMDQRQEQLLRPLSELQAQVLNLEMSVAALQEVQSSRHSPHNQGNSSSHLSPLHHFSPPQSHPPSPAQSHHSSPPSNPPPSPPQLRIPSSSLPIANPIPIDNPPPSPQTDLPPTSPIIDNPSITSTPPHQAPSTIASPPSDNPSSPLPDNTLAIVPYTGPFLPDDDDKKGEKHQEQSEPDQNEEIFPEARSEEVRQMAKDYMKSKQNYKRPSWEDMRVLMDRLQNVYGFSSEQLGFLTSSVPISYIPPTEPAPVSPPHKDQSAGSSSSKNEEDDEDVEAEEVCTEEELAAKKQREQEEEAAKLRRYKKEAALISKGCTIILKELKKKMDQEIPAIAEEILKEDENEPAEEAHNLIDRLKKKCSLAERQVKIFDDLLSPPEQPKQLSPVPKIPEEAGKSRSLRLREEEKLAHERFLRAKKAEEAEAKRGVSSARAAKITPSEPLKREGFLKDWLRPLSNEEKEREFNKWAPPIDKSAQPPKRVPKATQTSKPKSPPLTKEEKRDLAKARRLSKKTAEAMVKTPEEIAKDVEEALKKSLEEVAKPPSVTSDELSELLKVEKDPAVLEVLKRKRLETIKKEKGKADPKSQVRPSSKGISIKEPSDKIIPLPSDSDSD